MKGGDNMIVPIVPVPLIVRGRIIRKFRKFGAIGADNAKTLAELELDEFPFTAFGAKRIFKHLQKRGIVAETADKYYLAK